MRRLRGREGDQFALDLRFHLLREETAEVGGRRLGPGRSGKLSDGRVQDFFGDGAGFGGEFPGAAEIERAAAIVAIEAGALAAEKCALGMFGVFQPGAASEADVQFREHPGELHGPEAEVGDGLPDGGRSGGSQMFEDGRNQTEIFLARLGGGQQLLGDFGEEIERAGGGEIVQQCRTASAADRRNRC